MNNQWTKEIKRKSNIILNQMNRHTTHQTNGKLQKLFQEGKFIVIDAYIKKLENCKENPNFTFQVTRKEEQLSQKLTKKGNNKYQSRNK